jgi:hypothetical protein
MAHPAVWIPAIPAGMTAGIFLPACAGMTSKKRFAAMTDGHENRKHFRHSGAARSAEPGIQFFLLIGEKTRSDFRLHQAVIPAHAGIHLDFAFLRQKPKWIPACAGMTS